MTTINAPVIYQLPLLLPALGLIQGAAITKRERYF